MAGIDSYTKLCLHFDGEDESTVFTDSSASAHEITVVGGAQIDTGQSKFGGASGLFGTTGTDYITLASTSDFTFGTNPFTIDLWVRFSSFTLVNEIFHLTGTGGKFLRLYYYYYSEYGDGTLSFYVNGGSAESRVDEIYVDEYTFNLNEWYHIAVVRGWGESANNFAMTVNGELLVSYEHNVTLPEFDGIFTIASGGVYSSTYQLYGNIDEFRVSNGVARWTEGFTPNTEAYSEGEAPVSNELNIAISAPEISFDSNWDIGRLSCEIPIVTLSLDTRRTFGSFALSLPALEFELDPYKTTGELSSEIPFIKSEIESTYTIGGFEFDIPNTDFDFRSTSTFGSLSANLKRIKSKIASTYTLANFEFEIPKAEFEFETTSTYGLFQSQLKPIDAEIRSTYTIGCFAGVLPELACEVESTGTFGNLTVSLNEIESYFIAYRTFGDISATMRKPKIYLKSKTGTVGRFEKELNCIDFEATGYEVVNGGLSVQLPSIRTHRFNNV